MLPLFQTAGISPSVYIVRDGCCFLRCRWQRLFVLLMLYCMSVEPLLHCAEIPVYVLMVFYYFPVAAFIGADTEDETLGLQLTEDFSNTAVRH